MLQISYLPSNFRIVGKKEDFPAPVAGVISLPAGSNWIITNIVDLQGSRIVCAGAVAFHGVSAETCKLLSTGLAGSDALITTAYTIQIQSVSFEAETAPLFDIDGGGVAALDWQLVNFISTPVIGTIKNVSNFINSLIAFIDSGGMTLDGSVGTAAWNNSSFSVPTGQTAITLAATFNSTRRLRFVDCAFIAPAGANSITYTAGAIVPTDQLLFRGCNFSGGSASYITGITAQDNISDWSLNKGLDNSQNYGDFSMKGNMMPTLVLSTADYYKVLGTTIPGTTQRFTHSNNRLAYTGEVSRTFSIIATLSIIAGNNNVCEAVIRRFSAGGVLISESNIPDITTNGAGRAENVAIPFTTTLNNGEYIEAWVRNTSAINSITVSALSLIATLSQ